MNGYKVGDGKLKVSTINPVMNQMVRPNKEKDDTIGVFELMGDRDDEGDR